MQSDLARFQLFQLNENLIRLHGLCANFSPEIIKHDRMNADMTVAKQKYDEIVRESLLHARQTRQRDPSPVNARGWYNHRHTLMVNRQRELSHS